MKRSLRQVKPPVSKTRMVESSLGAKLRMKLEQSGRRLDGRKISIGNLPACVVDLPPDLSFKVCEELVRSEEAHQPQLRSSGLDALADAFEVPAGKRGTGLVG